MLNILIRTSNRPELFKRCLDSILSQTYKEIRIIVCYDRKSALRYIPEELEKFQVYPDRSKKFFYDAYCNELKARVTEGHFMFLDDDDFLVENVLSQLPLIENDAIICQYKRKGVYPNGPERILPGKIGMPCLILHHKFKGVADIPVGGVGDYHWIKKVTDHVPYLFLPLIVSMGDARGYGK